MFADADDTSLYPIAAASYVEHTPKGQVVFSVGDEPDGLRIVLSGEVRIWLEAKDGREMTLAYMSSGDAFGEVAMLDGLERTANATTTRDTECLFLPADAMADAVNRDHALAKHLIYSLCEMMRRNLGTISSLAFASLDIRLAKLIYELSIDFASVEDNRATFHRKFSQNELARMLGVSREAVNKRYKAFEREGLVVNQGARLVVPDLEALIERAEENPRTSPQLL